MMKSLKATAASACLVLAGAAIAQDNDQPVEIVSKIVPVEVWACSYNEGQGPSELDAAVDAWTGFADANGVDDYAAWTLTPHYFGPNQSFDFLWLGAWTDGNAMGAGTDMLYGSGAEYLANFVRVATCNSHTNAGSISYKLPSDDAPQDLVITFSNCSIEDGASYQQVVEATQSWSSALTEAGSQAAIYHWFPIYGGGGDDTPDFIRLNVYPNHTELGADYERITNGEMFRQSNALFGALVNCDAARVYNAQSRRVARLR
jgi:opacity protein-like surface antigen